MPVLRIRTAAGTWEDVSVPVAPPANMVTTDTAQTVSGVKTFAPGTLLVQNGAGVTAEPYSDANAPGTMERTVVAAPTTNPPAGEAIEYTIDGKSLDMRAADGTVTRIGPSAGASGPTVGATQDYVDTTPAPPTTGVTVFSRSRARRLLSTVGPSGQDTSYQPAIFANRLALVRVINATAAPTTDGVALTNYSTPVAQSVATTNFFTGMVRTRYSSTATAGTAGGIRSTTGQWFLSSTANLGGFFFVCRFGIAVANATNRIFVGLSPAALTNVNPSTFVNAIGFGCDAAQTTMRFITNGAAAATANHVDLGANFPATSAGTLFYEARVFVPSGSTGTARWSIHRLNDGITATGTATAGLPAANTLLMSQFWHNNGTTASAVSIDLQSMYVETDN